MAKQILILLIFKLLFCPSYAQSYSSSGDSVKVFYHAFFDLLKKRHVFKDAVNWPAIESDTYQRLSSYQTVDASITEVSAVLSKIGDTHSKLFYKDTLIQARLINFPNDLFSENWIYKYRTNPGFEVKILDSSYGYILMPAIQYTDKLDFNQVSQQMYDKIYRLKMEHNLKGWIIDLRFNTGGTCVPMLLSLYDFLGNGPVWNSTDENGIVTEAVMFQKGKYMTNGHTVAKIKTRGSDLENVKVALLTGVVTGSSGEIVAIAFKCRSNTIYIGEKTAGFTTVNNTFPLPFNAIIALSVSHASDCKSNRYASISPDYVIKKNDNFENLLSDEHIQVALQFFNQIP